MKTPAEIAEANRIKDEAADDLLIPEYIATVEAALEEYRGEPIVVPLPGVSFATQKIARGYFEFCGTPKVMILDRFRDAVRRHFAVAGWDVKFGFDGLRSSLFREKTVYALSFQAIEESSKKSAVSKPDRINEPELPEHLTEVPVSRWGRIWGASL